MKIAFILPGLGFGGAERVVCHLANRMAERHNISIITTEAAVAPVYPLHKDIKLASPPTGLSTVKIWIEVRKICKSIKPDVVIAFMMDMGIMTSLVLCGTGIPVITSERNDPFVERKEAGAAMRMLGRISSLFTAWYVFQSEGAKSYYSKRIQRKSSIILNPLEVDKLPQRDPDCVDHRIVSVGRLHAQKNQTMLIKAFAASTAPQAHTLHIYGDGPLHGELENLIAQLGMQDKVFLEGNSNQIYEEIKQAKLFVFTSDREGLPNALMEAMAIGVPCVSTDCSPGGARMLIESGENGILIPCGDVDALASAFDELLADADRLAQFSANGQKLRETVSLETIANRWLECISQVV